MVELQKCHFSIIQIFKYEISLEIYKISEYARVNYKKSCYWRRKILTNITKNFTIKSYEEVL